MRRKMNDYVRAWNNKDRCWLYFHRFVAEQKIGRSIESHEQVHHIDGNVLNNNMNNLEVITRAEHMSHHKPVYQRKFRPVKK